MIYNTNKDIQTESVALFGEDADKLLESLDIELGESTIAIGENVYDGAEAEQFLNENGILLYDDHIVLEGKQAEEYKARKAAEKKKAEEFDSNPRNTDGYRDPYNKGGRSVADYMKGRMEDSKRNLKSLDIADREREKRYKKHENDFYKQTMYTYKQAKNKGKNSKDDPKMKELKDNVAKSEKDLHNITGGNFDRATDAINRHMRRHPEQYKESSIFNFDIK